MAIKIGQIRYDSNTQYLAPILNDHITRSTSTGNTTFQDFAIRASFEAGVTYYVRVDLERIAVAKNMGNSGTNENDPHIQNIEVKLYANSNTTQYQTIGDIIVVEPYDAGEGASTFENEDKFILWCTATINKGDPNIANYPGASTYFENLQEEHNTKIISEVMTTDIRTPWKVIELVFTPFVSSNELVFELRRVSYDYNNTSERIVKVNTASYDVATVTNILPVNAEKIGIQSRPGTLVVINGEGMRVGKSGILELNSGVTLTSVGIAAPEGSIDNTKIDNTFILDYIYTE